MNKERDRVDNGSPSATPDDAFIRSAIGQANLNALRMALYQWTRDPELAAMDVEQMSIGGGAIYAMVVCEKDRARLKEIAFRLLRNLPSAPFEPIRKEDSRVLMEMFNGHPISDPELQYGFEELAFEQFPRGVKWTTAPDSERLKKFKVTIIGAGISGIAMGVQLGQLGIPYTIVERQPGLGGTWWINDYPEARVDISSFLYQFKFEKNYPWSEFYASGKETLEYLAHVAKKYNVLENIQFSTELVAAKWDEQMFQWRYTLRHADGQEREHESNIIVSAVGLFAIPKLPDIKGIGDFEGVMFHTTAWNHEYDYAGKRIALIGTGSTGTQLMPSIASIAKSLTVFQRTPNWIMKIENYRGKVTRELRWLYDNVPYYWNWYNYASFLMANSLQGVQVFDRDWQKNGGLISERNDSVRATLTAYIRDKLGDDTELFRKCLPDYAPFARRLVVDNGWYDALRRENVELVTERIDRFTPTGIRTADGVERGFDAVILAAGFHVSRYLSPVRYEGRGGTTLEESWARDGARSFLGLMLPKYPNFFMFYGPNSQPRSGGFYSWAEVWSRYSAKLIVRMIETGLRSIECRQDVFDDYNRRMDAATKQLIWETEGKAGYYVNEFGRSGVNLPWNVEDYHAWTLEPNIDDFITK